MKMLFAQTPALSEFTGIRTNEIYIKDAETGVMRKVSSSFNDKASLFRNSITGECTCNNLLSEVTITYIGQL
jgi:hypothetical protein